MRRVVIIVALVAGSAFAAAAPVTGASSTEADSLRQYLSSMAWPTRASVARAHSVNAAIDGVITAGDPPFMRGVAARCRNLRAVEARGRLLQIKPPAKLQPVHLRLSRAYSKLRAGCTEARLTALGVAAALDRYGKTRSAADKAAWQQAETRARIPLRRFALKTIPSFIEAGRVWRWAVFQYAVSLRVQTPKWVRELPIEHSRAPY